MVVAVNVEEGNKMVSRSDDKGACMIMGVVKSGPKWSKGVQER